MGHPLPPVIPWKANISNISQGMRPRCPGPGRGCRAPLWGEARVATSGHSWFQPAPTSQVGGTSGEKAFKKGKNATWQCEEWGRSERSSPADTQATDWQQPPFPSPLHCSGWGGGQRSQEWRSQTEPGKGQGRGRGYFNFCICFSLPESILIANKSNLFSSSQVCFVHDSKWQVISLSLCPTMSFFI